MVCPSSAGRASLAGAASSGSMMQGMVAGLNGSSSIEVTGIVRDRGIRANGGSSSTVKNVFLTAILPTRGTRLTPNSSGCRTGDPSVSSASVGFDAHGFSAATGTAGQ